MKTKFCTRCKEEKPVTCFYKNRSRKDGRAVYCASCEREYARLLVERSPIILEEKRCNKCGEVKPVADFYKDKAKRDGLTTFCRKCKNESNRQWREQNIDYHREISFRYRRRKVHEKSVYDKKYGKRRRAIDEDYIYKRRILSCVRGVIIKQSKGSKYEKYLGCSVQEYRDHIESQFQKGMSWDNYGDHRNDGWVIDHIIPISKFNLRKEKDRYKCFHYTNVQPLWWWQNQIKYTKVMNEKELRDLRKTGKIV